MLAPKDNRGSRTWRCGRSWKDIPPRPDQRHKHVWPKDHIIPLIAGGTDDTGNVQLLCYQCNPFKYKGFEENTNEVLNNATRDSSGVLESPLLQNESMLRPDWLVHCHIATTQPWEESHIVGSSQQSRHLGSQYRSHLP